jgi:hypothetical protein
LLILSGNLFVYFVLAIVVVGCCHYLLWGRSLSLAAAAEPTEENTAADYLEDGYWSDRGGVGRFDADLHG